MTVPEIVTLAIGCAAVIEDISRRRVSNWTSGSALLLGLVFHYFREGWRGVAAAAAGAAVGFAVFLVFYLLGGLGGGDVKLMAGFGSLLGPGTIFCAAWFAAVLGAFMALGRVTFLALRSDPRAGRTAAHRDAIPYAPAIVAGVWLAALARG